MLITGVSAILSISPNAAELAFGPYDHGFAQVVSFRDPDGNHVEILEPARK